MPAAADVRRALKGGPPALAARVADRDGDVGSRVAAVFYFSRAHAMIARALHPERDRREVIDLRTREGILVDNVARGSGSRGWPVGGADKNRAEFAPGEGLDRLTLRPPAQLRHRAATAAAAGREEQERRCAGERD